MSESWTNSLLNLGAEFDAGRVTGFSATPAQDWSAQSNGLCDLSHYGLIRVSGEDAGRFLQAQLTNDVLALEVGAAQLNGWCSPKGRLLAVFTLWREADAYFLMLPRSLRAGIQARMGMFVLRSKVVVADVSDTTVRLGLTANSPVEFASLFPDAIPVAQGTVMTIHGGTAVRISHSRAILVLQPTLAEARWRELSSLAATLTANAWDLSIIREGVVEVLPETQDTYVPQMTNFELVGGVSFKKGCYPGQEIVARTQYRGILKRRMVRVQVALQTALAPGAPIYSPAFPDQAAGSVVISARSDKDTVEALVVAQLDAIEHNGLFLDQQFTAAGRFELLALPYSLPNQS